MQTYCITGANRGIGLELVKQLSASSTNKIIASVRDKSRATELSAIAAKNSQVSIVTLDLGDIKSIDALDGQLSEVTERIDVFIANAGIADPQVYYKVTETEYDLWTRHFQINTFGTIFTFNKVVKYLEKSTVKKVLFVSSIAASMGSSFGLSSSAYGSSKAALNFTAHTLSFELGPQGYIIIPVHPGVVLTEMGNACFQEVGRDDPSVTAQFEAMSIPPSESAAALIDLVEKADTSYNGKFMSYDGSELNY